MLIMPILINSSKHSKICSVEIKLKDATKVKKSTKLKGFGESNIIVNGTSFNGSVYDIKNKKPNVVVNFIRNNNVRTDKKDFLISTRSSSSSDLYDLYNVEIPLRKVSSGLDNLLGSVILDMQKEIPDIDHGREIDLQDLEVDFHITKEKVDKLRYIVENVDDKNKWDYLFTANGVSDLKATLDFMDLFDFTIISEATIEKEQLDSMINSFSHTFSKSYKELNKFYTKASHNRDVFHKLNTLSQLIYEKPIQLIHHRGEQKVLVRKKNESIGDVNAA